MIAQARVGKKERMQSAEKEQEEETFFYFISKSSLKAALLSCDTAGLKKKHRESCLQEETDVLFTLFL